MICIRKRCNNGVFFMKGDIDTTLQTHSRHNASNYKIQHRLVSGRVNNQKNGALNSCKIGSGGQGISWEHGGWNI